MPKQSLKEELQDVLIEVCTNFYNAGLTHEEVTQALKYAIENVKEAAEEDNA